MQNILESCQPEVFHEQWNDLKRRRCIMVSHDQNIDRRIMQEAETLISNNYNVLIICLSGDNQSFLEIQNNVLIHRISLLKIVPNDPIHLIYKKFDDYVSKLKRVSFRIANCVQRFLWILYKVKVVLKLCYRNKSINYPLPFDYAFKYVLNKYLADLIIAHDLPALKASVQRGEELGVPIIYDAHEFYSEQKVFSAYQKKIMFRCEQKYITKCADILTVNHYFIDLFKKRYEVQSGHVIRNSCKFHLITPITTLHSKIAKPINEQLILFQGGISRDRNLINLLKGFLLVKRSDVNLVFMGPHDEILLKRLQKIAGNNLEQNVFFLEPVPQDQLIDLTSTATFGVIPYKACDLNTTYCTPNKLFEYIQAELPILYNNDLKEVAKIMSEIGGGMSGDMSSPRKVKHALETMLTRDLEIDKRIIKSSKHEICWERDAERFMRVVNISTGCL